MNKLRKIPLLGLLALISLPGPAQEYLLPLASNPHARTGLKHAAGVKAAMADDTLDLPIREDFSSFKTGLNMSLWTGKQAFANNNFCISPPSIGVVSLDALDENGSIYASATISPVTFGADTLESRPINLEYPVSDSIYLSFFYQPAGLCDEPEEKDSLVLEFYAPDPLLPDTGIWHIAWSMEGSSLHDFTQIMVPVKDPDFLKPDFRFRFRNRASLSQSNDFPDKRGNADYWHIDYIRLDRQRSISDTILKDVTFTSDLSPLFKTLSIIPWAHFESARLTELRPMLETRYINHDDIPHNVTRSLFAGEPLYNEWHEPSTATAQDLPAFEDTLVEYSYVFPIDFDRGDSALVRFKAALRTDEYDPKENDTLVHDQWFKDFYAYDDGTAEAGYGLLGEGTSNGKVALRYTSFVPDQLSGVYIAFNQLYDSVNLDYGFTILIWDDLDGFPGEIIHEEWELSYPVYSTEYPGFVRFDLSSKVDVDGDFYIGWRQQDDYKLNVGFDLNSSPGQVLYYNTGSWSHSEAPGALMMRPLTSLRNTSVEPFSETTFKALHVWPNPTSDLLFFDSPLTTPTGGKGQIFDLSGRCLMEFPTFGGQVDVSSLDPGIYVLRMEGEDYLQQAKIILQR